MTAKFVTGRNDVAAKLMSTRRAKKKTFQNEKILLIENDHDFFLSSEAL